MFPFLQKHVTKLRLMADYRSLPTFFPIGLDPKRLTEVSFSDSPLTLLSNLVFFLSYPKTELFDQFLTFLAGAENLTYISWNVATDHEQTKR
jgi:hypothetical protein